MFYTNHRFSKHPTRIPKPIHQDEEIRARGLEIGIWNPLQNKIPLHIYEITPLQSMCKMSKINSKYLLSVFTIILYYYYHYIKTLKHTLRITNDFLNMEYFVQLICGLHHEVPLVFLIVFFRTTIVLKEILGRIFCMWL